MKAETMSPAAAHFSQLKAKAAQHLTADNAFELCCLATQAIIDAKNNDDARAANLTRAALLGVYEDEHGGEAVDALMDRLDERYPY